MQAEDSAKFDLPLQKVSCPPQKVFSLLVVKIFDLFNDSMEVVSAGVVHGNACLHLVTTTNRINSFWFLESTPRLKKIYSACDLLTRTLYTVYTAAGAGSDRRTLHVSYVL